MWFTTLRGSAGSVHLVSLQRRLGALTRRLNLAWVQPLVHPGLHTGDLRIAMLIAAAVGILKWSLAQFWCPPERLIVTQWSFGFEAGHIAAILAGGHGMSIEVAPEEFQPTAWFSPLYPLLLSSVFRLLGVFSNQSAHAIVLLNCAFQGVVAGLLYLLGTSVRGRSVGLVAAALFLCNPNLWQFLSWAWPTHLFTLFLVLHIATLMYARSAGKAGGALVGATLALALLTDGAAISILPVTVMHLVWIRTRTRSWSAAGGALLAYLVLMTPWTAYNYSRLGSANPLRGNVGVNLWVGNHPGSRIESYHGLKQSPWHNEDERQLLQTMGESAYGRHCRGRMLTQVLSDPGRFLGDTARRASGFWMGEWWSGYDHIAWFYSVGIVAFSVLATIGAWRARSLGVGPIIGAVLLFGVPYYLTVHGHGRYRVPIEPLLCLLAALAICKQCAPTGYGKRRAGSIPGAWPPTGVGTSGPSGPSGLAGSRLPLILFLTFLGVVAAIGYVERRSDAVSRLVYGAQGAFHGQWVGTWKQERLTFLLINDGTIVSTVGRKRIAGAYTISDDTSRLAGKQWHRLVLTHQDGHMDISWLLRKVSQDTVEMQLLDKTGEPEEKPVLVDRK